MKLMQNVVTIAKKRAKKLFCDLCSLCFYINFFALTGAFTFYLGNFFVRGQAELDAFFQFHPWLYLLLIPAVSMRLWAEERKTGTIEFLITLPVTTFASVLGKYIAAWIFTGVAYF